MRCSEQHARARLRMNHRNEIRSLVEYLLFSQSDEAPAFTNGLKRIPSQQFVALDVPLRPSANQKVQMLRGDTMAGPFASQHFPRDASPARNVDFCDNTYEVKLPLPEIFRRRLNALVSQKSFSPAHHRNPILQFVRLDRLDVVVSGKFPI